MHQPPSRPSSPLCVRCITGLVSVLFSATAWADTLAHEKFAEVDFNTDMLRGLDATPVDISRFRLGNFAAVGDYTVPVYVNDVPVGRNTVRLRQHAGDSHPQPCLDASILELAGVDPDKLGAAAQQRLESGACLRMAELIPAARAEFDNGEQRLDLRIPQISLRRSARGYVDPKHWNDGIPAAMLRYNANLYRSSTDYTSASTQGYLGLDSGFNAGPWRFRHRGNLTYLESAGTHYQSIQTYVQRSLPPLKSQFTAGELYTDGAVLESIGMRGIQLSSDDRMYPESQRGYAPTIRGIANSNARVSVRQGGNIIYETTVAAGEFEIDDLYPTGYGGDLEVVVTEADGSEHVSRVPYAAPVNALRAGTTRYSLAAGRYRDPQVDDDPYVFQGTIRHGFNNLLTGYGGVTLSEHYQAGELGVALNTPWGAFGLDATHAEAGLKNQPNRSGQSYSLSYSRLFEPTETSVTLAAYRYSTSGFLGFNDTMRLRSADVKYAMPAGYGTAKGRFQLTLNQPLGRRWGSLYASGYSQNYWGRNGRDTEYQLGYRNVYKRVNYSISASRQYSLHTRDWEHVYMLNFSLPLGSGVNGPRSNTTIQHNTRDDSTSVYQSLTGSLGSGDNPLHYGLSASHTSRDAGNTNNASVNATWNSPYAQIGATASRSTDSKQVSASISGAVVAWSGGVALAPSLGDTFAIVEAPGAAGARITNTNGLRVNSRGHALVSNLVPYARNTVEVDPEGLPLNVQFASTMQHVAPTAGAIVPLKFQVESAGTAAIVRARRSDGEPLPFGADVLDGQGNQVGTVAQGSRIIAHGLKVDSGRLTVKWGKGQGQQCAVDYALPARPTDTAAPFHMLEGVCTDIRP